MTLLSAQELEIIRDRALNGPYKSTGDAWAYSPGAWDDIVIRADKLMNDEVNELWDGVYTDDQFTLNPWPSQYSYSCGQHYLAAGLYYLVKGDSAYGIKARDAVLAQVAHANPDYESFYTRPPNGWSNLFHVAGVNLRMFFTFEYTRDLWTTQQISDFEDYMEKAMPVWLEISEYALRSNFPQRLNRYYPNTWPLSAYNSGTTYAIGDQVVYTDTHCYQSKVNGNTGNTPAENTYWTRITGSAASAGNSLYTDTDPRSWTHKNITGTWQNRLRRVHENYGNQPALCMLAYGIWAIYKNDATKIDRTKIFFEETLMMGTFPDGTLQEYIRNDSSWPQKGVVWYGMIMIDCHVVFAEALRRKGDLSVYQFTTSKGVWGTEGGSKSILLQLNTLKDACTQDIVRYYANVQDSYKFDTITGTTYRWKPELVFAIANLHYNDNDFKDTYLLNNAQYTYNYSGGPSYVADGKWVGGSSVYGGVPILAYGMEGVYTQTPVLCNRKILLSC